MRMLQNSHGAMKSPWLLPVYEETFGHLQDEEVSFLELGILGGGSLKMWSDYFPNGQVIGFDMEPYYQAKTSRITTFRGDQADPAALQLVIEKGAPFDIIIDDCAHQGHLARASFNLLFPHLKPGGFYIIEDWGTGYWGASWPDGNGQNYVHGTPYKPGEVCTKGMVGLIHELVDEVGAPDHIRPYHRPSVFEYTRISYGLAVFKKAY
jgi:SAM-dependent methyltransferase